MAVRVRYKLVVAVSSTNAEERDLGNLTSEVVVDSQTDGGSFKTTLDAGVTDVQIHLDNISACCFLALKVNTVNPQDTLTEIQVKKNSNTGEVISVVPLSGAKEAHLLLSTSSITSLFVTNPGTVAVELTVFMAGD